MSIDSRIHGGYLGNFCVAWARAIVHAHADRSRLHPAAWHFLVCTNFSALVFRQASQHSGLIMRYGLIGHVRPTLTC